VAAEPRRIGLLNGLTVHVVQRIKPHHCLTANKHWTFESRG
jgi:hypothetical protein